jgi:translocation and assembly module TamB
MGPGRALRLAGRSVGVALGAVVALLVVAFAVLDTPWARRFAANEVNAILAPQFKGQIRIDALGALSPFGVGGADVTILDPQGHVVVVGKSLGARVATFRALRSLLLGHGPVDVELLDVTADRLDATLDKDASGQLGVVTAFDPKTPPAPPKPDDKPGRGLRLVFGRITVNHLSARGDVLGPPLDARIDALAASFTMAPEAIEADVAHAELAARGLPGGVDVAGGLTAHLRAPSRPGAVPDVRASWRGVVAGVTSALDASLQAGAVDAVLDAPQVTPEAIRAFWPASPFDKPGHLHVAAKGPLSRVVVAVRAGLADASADVDGWLAAEGDLRAEATLDAQVPQGRAQATVDLGGEGKARTLRFTLDARVAELDRIPRLPDVHGAAAITAKGTVDLDASTIEADTEATFDRLAVGPTRVGGASLDARAHGPFGALGIDAALHARGIVAAGKRVAWLDVGTRGSLKAATVRVSAAGPDIPRVSAGADVAIGPGVTLRGVHVAVARGADTIVVAVPSATIEGDHVRVSDARVDGAGGPASASFEQAGESLRVRAISEGLDLGVLARVAGLEGRVPSGVLAFDVDADLRRDQPKGRVAVHLDHGAFATARGVSAGVELALDGRRVKGRVHAEAEGVGVLDVATPKLVLPGAGPLSAASWRTAWGDVTLEARADLARLASLVPPEQFPFAQAAGKVSLRGHVARADAGDATPEVQLSATTEGLHLVPKVDAVRDIDGVWVVPYPPWHLDGIDFDADAHVDGTTGRVDLGTTARDAHGAFAHVDADSTAFPWDDALHARARLAADLQKIPFDLHLHVPSRGLATLPAMLHQDAVSGIVEADVKASGTMLAPKVNVTATVHDSLFGAAARPVAVQFDVSGGYDGHRAEVGVKVRADGREVMTADARATLAIATLLGSRRGAGAAWTGSAKAHFDGLPLKAVTALDDKLIAGALSGDVTVDGLHEEARAHADLTVDDLHVGSVVYKSGHVTGDADGSHLGGEVRIDQGDGFVDAKLDADTTWGAALAPALAEGRPLRGDLASKNFRIAALLPFLDAVLDELDGRLDSDAHMELDPRTRQSRLSGHVTLSRGAIEASAGGGEFHDISADVTLAPDGTFAVKKVSASGITGRLEATGSGKLVGTQLQNAKLEVTIPKSAAVPVSAGGAEIGNIDGKIDVSLASKEGGGLGVEVSVPSLRVTLPEASGGDVQSLGAMTDVRVGAHRGNPATFVLLPATKAEQAAAASQGSGGFALGIALGDVEVVRGTELKVDLDGKLEVAQAKVSGQIRLKQGGVLVIQGRTFNVDSGVVTFVGADASNPQVVVRAAYKAVDGTVVYATFTGPLKTGKVTLSAEPSLPQQEIVELLLFGTTGGPQAQSPSTDTASSVVGAVGGEAAQPLNHALNQMGLGAVRANVDTTITTNPRPEIEIQLARDISLKVAVVLGQVPPGVNPDHTLLTVAWRFLSRWSLASTLGDAGTTIFDLLWQRRY